MQFRILSRSAMYSLIAAILLATAPVLRGQTPNPLAPAPVAAPASPNPLAPTAAPAAGPSTQPNVMRFRRYVVTDETGFKGMEVFHGVMPVDWQIKGGVTWKMALGPPDLIRVHWSDAQDISAFDLYPLINFSWSNKMENGTGRYKPGQVALGNIVKQPPKDQFQAFDEVIVGMFRPDLKKAHVIKKEKMPEVAKALYAKYGSDPNSSILIAVGRETFEYDLKGQTVQEVVSGILVESSAKQMDFQSWSVKQATSERAPKGGFDQLQPVNSIMFQSLQANPEWNQKLQALLQQRQQQTLANQKQALAAQNARFNAIESRISSQSAANDAEHASYWQHSADLNRQSDAEADVQREVSPWTDSSGQTYKLPTTYGNAWSGADGQIIMNNDPSYNPNSDPNLTPTNWTPMQQAGN